MSWKALSSGKLVAGAIIHTGPCFYFGFICKNEEAAFAITLYDNTSGSGTEVDDYITDANKEMEGHVLNSPVVCSNGLYLALGGGSAIVYYTPLREGVQ